MSTFKKGDRVVYNGLNARRMGSSGTVLCCRLYPLDESKISVLVDWDNGGITGTLEERLLPEPEAPKGTFHALLIEALPQGGYTAKAPHSLLEGPGCAHEPLAAFTTLPEALAFVGRSMR